ncbi:MAG: apolipoprotein N-acyltransferase [Armatimonadetes bacterium]|nr:apolipoprotein N-acyltransferase [Armatimonadota bacterium]MDE2205794.1 apolipoprotein N-acyltransferase [Armatimonadota bacterium]
MAAITEAPTVWRAAGRGYLFAFLYLGAVWYWTGVTITTWSHSWIGWFAWLGLTAIEAVYYSAWAGAAWFAAQRLTGGRRILTLAGMWVVMEWLRAQGALTMPWAQLSYSQFRFLPLIQIADFTGAYGISFLIVCFNTALVVGWLYRSRRSAWRHAWMAAAAAVVLSLYGLARMQVAEHGRSMVVAVMQGPPQVGDTTPTVDAQLQLISHLTQQAASARVRPALILWGESAAPDDPVYNADMRRWFQNLADESDAALCVGARIQNPLTLKSSNGAVTFQPYHAPVERYNKMQLVPFGEYIPYRRLFPPWLSNSFRFFQHDVTPGAAQKPMSIMLPAGPVEVGPFICYESMYPRYARRMTQQGATMLITQSNDAWFQSRAAMWQHVSAVVLRAVENRRWIARATSTGVTCIVDCDGRIVRRAPVGAPGWIEDRATLQQGKTIYTRFGNWFVLLCALLCAALLFAAASRRRRNI